MILGDATNAHNASSGWATLDELFRRHVAQRGDALALADPPNRESFTGGAPRRLTYAEADRVVGAIARRLRELPLPVDAVVAIQLPNIVESVLTLLGVLRAGLIAAPLPLLWRRAEAAAALTRIGAQAFIGCRRVGSVDHGTLAMNVAADTFTIRFVCAFGFEPLDGVVGLDDLFAAEAGDVPAPARPGDPAAHLAVVTFDRTPDGIVPVTRNHNELMAGGLAVALASRWSPEAAILAAFAPSSFSGLATAIVPWLIGGGALSLHQPFDGEVFARQCAACDVAVVPGPLLTPLSQAGLLGPQQGVVAVWRAPENFAAAAVPSPRSLTDVLAFGEAGLVAMRRPAGGKPAALTLGPWPRDLTSGPVLAEVTLTAAGTIALGGAMVPRHHFPPGPPADGMPSLAIEGGTIDTLYPCRIGRDGAITIDGAPAGMVSVGGYRFALRELRELVARASGDGVLTALPDSLAGHRLAGGAADLAALIDALAAEGVNPLLLRAFRKRGPDRAA